MIMIHVDLKLVRGYTGKPTHSYCNSLTQISSAQAKPLHDKLIIEGVTTFSRNEFIELVWPMMMAKTSTSAPAPAPVPGTAEAVAVSL